MRRSRVLALALPLVAVTAAPPAHTAERRTANDGNVVLDGVPELPAAVGATLERYSHLRSATFRSWSRDGSSLYVTTRFGGVNQLHRVDTPGGARHQLTFFDEPVAGGERRPDGDELVFRMDEGGSELYQLFLLDPSTGDARRLTDGASRNTSPEWAPNGTRLAYLSTRRDGRSNDVWVMDVAEPAGARVALAAPGGSLWIPADWSADGERLLVSQYVSITDSSIHLLDVASGERRRLAGGDGGAGNHLGITPTFAADGRGYFSAHDRDGDFTRLVFTRLDSGESRTITGEIDWNVDDFALSDDGRRAAFVVNEEGIDRLYLLDPATFAYRRIEAVPIGRVGGLGFSPDGRRLALTLNTSQAPSDVYTLALGDGPLAAGELVRWTFSEVGGLDTSRFVVPELVRYPTFDSVDGTRRRIPAFVYRPAGEGPHPVIIYVHGGPEGQFRPGFQRRFQLWVAELGAAVVAPNVRGSSGYGKRYVALDNGLRREDSVRDVGALLDWIATQPDLDASRVAIYGGSYGGYMVLASLVHYGDRLRAGAESVGISNFVTFLENTRAYRRDLRRVEYGDERDPEMRAFLERISPNRNAASIHSPLFVAQGQNDPRVPVTESEQIVRDVRAAGHEVWYMNALNEGHGFRKKENRDLFDRIVFFFFQRHLADAG